jgi:hypothetical protein
MDEERGGSFSRHNAVEGASIDTVTGTGPEFGGKSMSKRKHVPVVAGANGKLCPVCGKRSYSAAGTHPQCALHQAEAARKQQMAAEKAAEEKPPAKAPREKRTWRKKCPECDADVHIRKKVCDCGHNFFSR